MPPPPSPLHLLALDAAIAQAEKSLAEGGIPIGAALMTPEGTIVAADHNKRVQSGDTTAHGEISCLRAAGRRRDWHELTMATTLSPCPMCSGAAVLHKLKRIIIGENQTFQGQEDWLREAGIEVIVLNDERCITLMQTFITNNPDLWHEDIAIPPTH